MSFLSFLSKTISSISHVAETASNLCQVIEPALQVLETGAVPLGDAPSLMAGRTQSLVHDGSFTIGFVRFNSVEELLTYSMNLKRQEVFLKTLATTLDKTIPTALKETIQNASKNASGDDLTKFQNQVIWIHMTSILIAEAMYLQKVLVTGKSPKAHSTGKSGEDPIESATAKFKALSVVIAGYATDLSVTVMDFGIISGYLQVGSEETLSLSALGREDNWEYSHIRMPEMKVIGHLIDDWNTFFGNTAGGAFGDRVRQLKVA